MEPVMTTDFNRLAPFYDPDYGEYQDDIPLYLNFARRTGDPILEVACGTGRVLIPLARAGYRVTGVDIAPAMLAIARQKVQRAGLEDRVTLVEVDARVMDLGQQFPLALVAANSFMHHVTLEQQRQALVTLHRHLRPGGLLILDLFNPDLRALLEADGRVELVKTWEEGETGVTVMKFQHALAFPTQQRLDVTYIYDRVYPDGRVERTVAPFSLRYLWPSEVRLLVESAGLEVEALYGTYDLDPVRDDHPRIIVVARRRS